MKTADLVVGPQTDALVALAQDWVCHVADNANPHDSSAYWVDSKNQEAHTDYYPSTNPAQWAELIYVFNIKLSPVERSTGYFNDSQRYPWSASVVSNEGWDSTFGAGTIGLAICKAVIAAEWGDEIPADVLDML